MKTRRLEHENGEAGAFCAQLPQPARIGIEATGCTQWFERMEGRDGARIVDWRSGRDSGAGGTAAEGGRSGGGAIADLLLGGRFPRVWAPSPEGRVGRQLLRHRAQLVRTRTSVKN